MKIQGIAFDLDGVIWHDYTLAPGAAEVVQTLRRAGMPIAFLTNSSARSTHYLAERLADGGILNAENVLFTSARLAASFIRSVWKNELVVAHGEYGALLDELRDSGLPVCALRDLDTSGEGPIIVCVGYARDFGYSDVEKLLAVAPRVTNLYASERDRWYGSIDGPKPGAGWVVAACETVLGQEATVLGKPNGSVLKTVAASLQVDVTSLLMVGDSIDSDIVAARNANAIGCLLRTDDDGLHLNSIKPDFCIETLSDVLAIVLG